MRQRVIPILACLALAAAVPAVRPLRAQAPTLASDTSWVARSVLYEVFVRSFSPSGDLRGVTAGLDRIQAAGANTVWLMPIQPSGIVGRKGTLGSPYAVRDWRAIDSAYGTADDLRALVRAAHERGMKVILDWVPDHTAPDHPWVRAHPDWYFRDSTGAPMVPRDERGRLTDWTDVVQLDYRNAELQEAMVNEMFWWLRTYELDGFRVDVAGFVPSEYWGVALPALRANVPRTLLLLAEWGDLDLHRRGFDLTYGWDGYNRIKAVWRGAPADTIVRMEFREQMTMPAGGHRLRFTTNHDETAWDNPPVTIFGGVAGARAAFVAMVLLPGRPLLYNGQEVESPQKLRLFERDALVWAQPGADSARAFYARVLRLTHSDSALIAGDFGRITTTTPSDVIAYRRGDVVVLVNPRPREARFSVSGVDLNGARDLLSDRVQRGGPVTLPAYGTMVLRYVR
jgi:glycosidase